MKEPKKTYKIIHLPSEPQSYCYIPRIDPVFDKRVEAERKFKAFKRAQLRRLTKTKP
jgi:hypothetical protein